MLDFIKNIFSKNTQVVIEKFDQNFVSHEVQKFKTSTHRQAMVTGEKYYQGKHDIIFRQRTAIGDGGQNTVISNLPNNKIIDNQYKKMVDQKSNYILGKPFLIECENSEYKKEIKKIINKRFFKLIKNISEDSLNCGVGWLYLYYNELGELSFERFKPYEIIPFYKDFERTELDYFIRVYTQKVYEKNKKVYKEKVEVYDKDGITFYEMESSKLKAVYPFKREYFKVNVNDETVFLNWEKIPLIPFKYNNKEIPLINMVKSLQDGINSILSNFQNNMEEDCRNTIMVLVNYDGESLGEFRRNLATYGAVKIRSDAQGAGDLKTLQVEVNAENYKAILSMFKRAIIENAMGFDAKDDRMVGTMNQMNIKSMYSDIDLDANGMETEFQASFEQLFWFINTHLKNFCGMECEPEVSVLFNRDMLMNEGDIIDNINKSVGILSTETLISQHPWVNDVEKECRTIRFEQ